MYECKNQRTWVARSTVFAMMEWRTALVRMASLPPLSSRPLPEAMARAATCVEDIRARGSEWVGLYTIVSPIVNGA